MAQSNILIFGATGNIGLDITKAIVQARESFGHISIFTSESTLSSKRETIEDLKQEGVQVIVGDVNNLEDVRKAYTGLFFLLLTSHSVDKFTRIASLLTTYKYCYMSIY